MSPLRIGRSPEVHLNLPNISVSRTHAILDKDQSGWNNLCEKLKVSNITTFTASDIGMGPVALRTLATSLPAVLTSMNCLNNPLGEGVHTIIKVFEETPRLRTLCGLEEGVEQIDWSNSKKGPADVALLAAELKAGRAAAALTSVNCLHNPLGEGLQVIIKVFEETQRLRTLCGLEEGIKMIDLRNSNTPVSTMLNAQFDALTAFDAQQWHRNFNTKSSSKGRED